MATPLFSPAGGYGSQTSSGGTVYQFGAGGWTPVASNASSPTASQPKATTTTKTTSTKNVMQQPQGVSTDVRVSGVPMPDISPDLSAIESAYNEQMNYLSNVENRLRPDYQSALDEAQKAFEAQQSMLGGQRTSAQQTLQEQQTKGQQSYESALADARRMYDQLQRGYQQRFGGASSAGQAATEIANQERLRQQGQNYRSLQDVTRQVQAGMQNIEQQYNQNLLALEQNKVSAINQAKRDFTDKLNQIDQMRATAGTNKAQAKLQALQNLRSQVLTIEASNRQFQQNLDLLREQARLQLQTSGQKLSGTANTVVTDLQKTLESLGKPQTTSAIPSTQQSAVSGSPYNAYLGQVRQRPQDLLNLPYTPMQSAMYQA